VFEGFSANYSGAGFSGMRFRAHSLSQGDFDAWVSQARASGGTLDRAAYLKLERPSEKEPVRRFASVEPQLFDRVVNLCVEPGKMCMHDMMAMDARGGAGRAGIYNVRALSYDKFAARGSERAAGARYVAAACTSELISADRAAPALVSQAPLLGAGLSRPGQTRRQSLTALDIGKPRS
jgi:cytochrome o ubiquinol oxidase subunit 2